VDELTCAEAIEKIRIDMEPLPFVIDRWTACGRAAPIRARMGTFGNGANRPLRRLPR